jgi:hypothetical protein
MPTAAGLPDSVVVSDASKFHFLNRINGIMLMKKWGQIVHYFKNSIPCRYILKGRAVIDTIFAQPDF